MVLAVVDCASSLTVARPRASGDCGVVSLGAGGRCSPPRSFLLPDALGPVVLSVAWPLASGVDPCLCIRSTTLEAFPLTRRILMALVPLMALIS